MNSLRFRRFSPSLASVRKFWTSRGRASAGQFGVEGLHSPEDWDTISRACVARSEEVAEEIRATISSPSPIILQLFDKLSNSVCSVLDAAELCRNVHPQPDFVEASDRAYNLVAEMTVGMNSDRTLYEPLLRLSASRSTLSSEERIMLTSLKVDFERGGIMLSSHERNEVANLQNRINVLGAKFSYNATNETAFVDVPRRKLGGVPVGVLRSLESDDSLPDGDNVRVRVGDPVMSPLLMKYARDADIRKQLFVAEQTRCAAKNLPVLDDLLLSRSRLSRLLGAESYASLMFQGRLASSPDEVESFLHDLSSAVAPCAGTDVALLVQRKSEVDPGSKTRAVEPWDRSFLMGLERGRVLEVDSRRISEYFSLQVCLAGIASILKDTFGIDFCTVPSSKSRKEVWHDDVWKSEVRHERKGVLGHIFFDLYPREGKYGHAAHFCIRGGREKEDGSGYQTPIVALVCNFARAMPGQPALLSVGDYETLWHELAHAIHSLVSHTRFQHLSGTRVAMDLVEVPSHMFEQFAWDPRVLSRIGRHFRSGDPIPSRYVSALTESRHQFAASDLQTQVFFSALDLSFHSGNPPIGRTSGVTADIYKHVTSRGMVEGTAPHASFHHFVGYGAGYYTYIFARMIASQIYSQRFQRNPFCRESGEATLEALMVCGASVNPSDALRDTLCDGLPSCRSYLKEAGLLNAVSEPSLDLKLPVNQWSCTKNKTVEV